MKTKKLGWVLLVSLILCIALNTCYANSSTLDAAVFVADAGNHLIRMILTKESNVYTVGGPSYLNLPSALTLSQDGSIIYIANRYYHCIEVLKTSDGSISVLTGQWNSAGYQDGNAALAKFNLPTGIAISADGATLIVADQVNQVIRGVTISTGFVSTLAGRGIPGYQDGSSSASIFSNPSAVAVSYLGKIFIADEYNNCIRGLDLMNNTVTTVAGNGAMGSLDGSRGIGTMNRPAGIAVTPDGLTILVADTGNSLIRSINTITGVLSTLPSSSSFTLNQPTGIAVSSDATLLFIGDTGNKRMLVLNITSGITSMLAGTGAMGNIDGISSKASFNSPAGLYVCFSAACLSAAKSRASQLKTLSDQQSSSSQSNSSVQQTSSNLTIIIVCSLLGAFAVFVVIFFCVRGKAICSKTEKCNSASGTSQNQYDSNSPTAELSSQIPTSNVIFEGVRQGWTAEQQRSAALQVIFGNYSMLWI